jgi:hypothetical protein
MFVWDEVTGAFFRTLWGCLKVKVSNFGKAPHD